MDRERYKEPAESVVERWGTKEEFYKELERFLKQHQSVNCIIEYDNDLQMPIKATYWFEPVRVAWEHIHLLKMLHDSAKQDEYNRREDEKI